MISLDDNVASRFRVNGIHAIPGQGTVTKVTVTKGTNRKFRTGELYPCKWVKFEVQGTLIAYVSPFGGELIPEKQVSFEETILIPITQDPEFKVGQSIRFEHRDAFGNNAKYSLPHQNEFTE